MHPLAIAAAVILGTLAIAYYAFEKGLPFSHPFTVSAVVSDSVNVRPGSPVRVAGVDVGSVQSVSPAGDATRITFTVGSKGLPLHTDATVRIRTRLVLEGGYYLDLSPGTPGAPHLRDGGTIPLSHTSSPVQFYRVLSIFTTDVRAHLTSTLASLAQGLSPRPGESLADSGAGGLKQAIPTLTPLAEDTAIVTRALQGTRPGDVGTLLRSGASLSQMLASNSAQLADLVRGLDVTSRALISSDDALAQSVSGLDATVKASSPALEAVDHALPPVGSLAGVLLPSLSAAPPLLDHLTTTAGQLATALAPAQRQQLLTSLQATFQQLPSVLNQLASIFPLSSAISDCLRTRVLPVLNESVPDGTLSTGKPVWQDFLHALPGIAGASGNFDANGHYSRVVLGGGAYLRDPQTGTVASVPAGNSALLGARPVWFGDLKPSDFRPDAKCTAQPPTSLASPTAPPDLEPGG